MDFQHFLGKEMHCSCGRVHSTDLKKIDIGEGVLQRLPETLRELGYQRPWLIADLNTWEAAGRAAAAELAAAGFSYEKTILQDRELVPDEKAVGTLLLHAPADADLVLAVGSGTINDLCKYVSHLLHKDYIIFASAPSMDGFVSSGAALIIDHMKTTLDAQAPVAVIGDTAVLSQAPMEMLTAGLGDMLGKYTCLADWKLAHLIKGEYYCEQVADLVRTALRTVLAQSSRIRERDPEVIGAVTEALVLTGIAMKFVGNSRPASGCEHHMSHYWEMLFLLDGKKPVLHGTKVGVATVAALRLYQMLANVPAGTVLNGSFTDVPNVQSETPSSSTSANVPKRTVPSGSFDFEAAAGRPFDRAKWEASIRAAFREAAGGVISLEDKAGKNDPEARNRRLETIQECLQEILWVIQHDLPARQEIEDLLLSLDAPVHPEQIGVSLQELHDAVLYAKEVRDRYTLLQLLWDLGLSEEFADRLRDEYDTANMTWGRDVPAPAEGASRAGDVPALAAEIPDSAWGTSFQNTYFRWKKAQVLERLRKIRCFVLDMDGTIYLSNRLFPFTIPFLNRVVETGRSYCFFTNNSTKHQQDYLDKLSGMDIPVTPAQVFLSTQVIVEEMQRLHPHDTFFIVGTPNLEEAFRRAGLKVFETAAAQTGTFQSPTAVQSGTSQSPAARADEEGGSANAIETAGRSGFGANQRPDVVILGFDTTLTYEKISLACKYLRHGAAYYGVNMDYNCPVDDNGVLDYIPDCGSIAKLVERSTGRFPDFYGKPSRHALDFIIRHTGFAEEEIAVVGDRIYTDIAIANGTKAYSIMVLTGETQMEDLEEYDFRPDLILPSLEELTALL